MHTHGPTKSEGNLTPPPGFEGANQGLPWCFLGQLARALVPGVKGDPWPRVMRPPPRVPGPQPKDMGPPAAWVRAASPPTRMGTPMAARVKAAPRPRSTDQGTQTFTTPPTSTPNPSSTPSIPIPATSNPPLPIPSPLSLPAASQLPRALADSPAANSAEPSTCPSPGAPSQQTPAPTDSPASPKSTKSPPAVRPKTNTPKKTKVEASTQVTPKRSFRKRQNNRSNNQREHLDPNRHWEETAQQQVQGLPPNPLPPLLQQHHQSSLTTMPNEQNPHKLMKTVTPSCHPDTNEEDIEEHLSEKFENISVKAHKTVMTHDYYTSFTVSVRGKNIKPELFLDSDTFPDNVKVFLNKNKYKRDQNV
nr:proline-rich receptor-like protein kinase PERK8 [Penaeus vannamei]